MVYWSAWRERISRHARQGTEPKLPMDAVNRSEGELRRRWTRILPAVFVTYSLAYLDRANYGFGAAAGLAETLHITDKMPSLLSALFFLGYFLFQFRARSLRRKRAPAGWCLARWLRGDYSRR